MKAEQVLLYSFQFHGRNSQHPRFPLERQDAFQVCFLTFQDSSSFTRLFSYILNVSTNIIMNSVRVCDEPLSLYLVISCSEGMVEGRFHATAKGHPGDKPLTGAPSMQIKFTGKTLHPRKKCSQQLPILILGADFKSSLQAHGALRPYTTPHPCQNYQQP